MSIVSCPTLWPFETDWVSHRILEVSKLAVLKYSSIEPKRKDWDLNPFVELLRIDALASSAACITWDRIQLSLEVIRYFHVHCVSLWINWQRSVNSRRRARFRSLDLESDIVVWIDSIVSLIGASSSTVPLISRLSLWLRHLSWE